MRLSGEIEGWGKAMISGFLFTKWFEIWKNSKCRRSWKGRTFRAPYLLMRVTFPNSLSGFTTTPKRISVASLRSIKAKGTKSMSLMQSEFTKPASRKPKQKTKVRNSALTIQKPNKLLIIHTRTDLDTNRIPNPPKIFHMRSRHLSRSVSDPKEVCPSVVKCIFHYSPRGSTLIDGFSCSTSYNIGRATRNGEFPCQGLFVREHKSFVTGKKEGSSLIYMER